VDSHRARLTAAASNRKSASTLWCRGPGLVVRRDGMWWRACVLQPTATRNTSKLKKLLEEETESALQNRNLLPSSDAKISRPGRNPPRCVPRGLRT
jgi:hypothetical protein